MIKQVTPRALIVIGYGVYQNLYAYDRAVIKIAERLKISTREATDILNGILTDIELADRHNINTKPNPSMNFEQRQLKIHGLERRIKLALKEYNQLTEQNKKGLGSVYTENKADDLYNLIFQLKQELENIRFNRNGVNKMRNSAVRNSANQAKAKYFGYALILVKKLDNSGSLPTHRLSQIEKDIVKSYPNFFTVNNEPSGQRVYLKDDNSYHYFSKEQEVYAKHYQDEVFSKNPSLRLVRNPLRESQAFRQYGKGAHKFEPRQDAYINGVKVWVLAPLPQKIDNNPVYRVMYDDGKIQDVLERSLTDINGVRNPVNESDLKDSYESLLASGLHTADIAEDVFNVAGLLDIESNEVLEDLRSHGFDNEAIETSLENDLQDNMSMLGFSNEDIGNVFEELESEGSQFETAANPEKGNVGTVHNLKKLAQIINSYGARGMESHLLDAYEKHLIFNLYPEYFARSNGNIILSDNAFKWLKLRRKNGATDIKSSLLAVAKQNGIRASVTVLRNGIVKVTKNGAKPVAFKQDANEDAESFVVALTSYLLTPKQNPVSRRRKKKR